MTRLDEIKNRFGEWVYEGRGDDLCVRGGYEGGQDNMLRDFRDLIEVAEDQDRMLSRVSQDSDAVALGRDEVVRTLRAWIDRHRDTVVLGRDAKAGYGSALDELDSLLSGRIEVSESRPRTEELLDLLWEAKKLRTVWKETGSHEALDRLLDLLGG